MKSQQGLAYIGILLIAAVSLAVTIGILATLKTKPVGPPTPSPQPTLSPTPSPSPKTTPSPESTPSSEPTPSPQPTLPPVKTKVANLNEQFTVQGGDVIEISNTGLVIKIMVIAFPSVGPYDLPNIVPGNIVGGQAFYGGQTEEFNLIVGGNQPFEVQEQKRQKKVFNTFTIYGKRVGIDGTTLGATLIVTK